MTAPAPVLALGVISGTSADGIDVAAVRTDGESVVEPGPAATIPYAPETRDAVLEAAAAAQVPDAATRAWLDAAVAAEHAAALRRLCAAHGVPAAEVAVVGFHGQTVFHDPAAGVTVQLGDPAAAARALAAPVVARLRDADMAAGGQGAPIAPLYHRALAAGLDGPVVVLNAGGVANLTFVDGDAILARDVGPANAPLDDWVRRMTGAPYDRDGALAAAGRVDAGRVERALAAAGFATSGPLALDRQSVDWRVADGLSVRDGAATLTALAVTAVARAAAALPRRARRWLVTGGGRRNPVYMAGLGAALDALVEPIEAVGADGDAVEAQAMAYLAVRSLRGLPLTLPGTTGCAAPTRGGLLFTP